jgi:hypothetical protein
MLQTLIIPSKTVKPVHVKTIEPTHPFVHAYFGVSMIAKIGGFFAKKFPIVRSPCPNPQFSPALTTGCGGVALDEPAGL